jgi:GH43 family beta-xylosidase
VPSNWRAKDDGPVFSRSDIAFGPGHASFTSAGDGTPYIVYHATQTIDGGWANRTIRAQSFSWNDDGTPNFPAPVGFNVELPLPA